MFVVKTKLDIIYDTLNHSFWLIEAHLIEQILIAGLRNTRGFPGSTGGKERDCQCRRETLFQNIRQAAILLRTIKHSHSNPVTRPGFDSWVRKISWRRKWQSSPVFLSRESYGQRSLAGYSPLGCKESDMTEATQHKEYQAT